MARNDFPKGSSQYINKLNKIKILNLIRENGKISRADLAKNSGISAPTVTRIIDSLINEEGLVHEVGEGVSRGGRKPMLLEFSGADNFVIGIDLGATNIYGMLSNLNAETIAEVRQPTDVDEGFEEIVDKISNVIAELLQHYKIQRKRIFGIGMAVAGLINKIDNIIEYSPDFHWNNVDIITELGKKTDLPIIIDNVTRCMAFGEMCYGIGRECNNFIVVNVGYGIGAGIIINGKPLYGARGMAGEFGHLTLQKDSSIRCECGNYGCLEALASGRAIAITAQSELQNGAKSVLLSRCNGDLKSITTEMVSNAAKDGDEVAKRVFDHAAEYIGIGIAGLVNIFSPEAVIIGGGVSQAGDLLFDTLKRVVNERSLHAISKNLRILPAEFGIKAAVKGSIALILNEILNLNHNTDV
ncbi:ROK family transcriptional regulator [bacterium]|nr:ROK family transcriptional regulator [bacterium]